MEPGEDWQQDMRPDRVMEIAPGGTGSDVTTLPLPAPSAKFSEAERLNKPPHENQSWWEKLKHVFTDDKSTSTHVTGDNATSEGKFGTGEGELGLNSNEAATEIKDNGDSVNGDYDYAYSPMEFEGSLTSLGLDRRQARAFARELGSNGAIVTVAAGNRISDAERILERNHGRIRYEEDTAYEKDTAYEIGPLADPVSSTQGSYDPRERIQLFGEVRRAYRKAAAFNHDQNDLNHRDDLRRPA